MKNIFSVFILICFSGSFLFSQTNTRPHLVSNPNDNKGGNVVTAITDPTLFIEQNMFGNCVQISNVQVNYGGKSLNQIGAWSDSTNSIGIDTGIILSTGMANGVIGAGSLFQSTVMSGPGDTTLSVMCGSPTYDAITIEFDFIPLADSIIPFEFVFGSEEYPEYVNSSYNDVFGFFVSGPGFTGLENIAIIPFTNVPITINTINSGSFALYYNDNSTGTFWVYDGYTTVFSLHVPVIANQQYHFKAALADAGDGIYDSGVVLKTGSFAGNIIAPAPSFTYTVAGNNVNFTNTTTSGMTYIWDFGDGTNSTDINPVHEYSAPGTYTLRLAASNHCYTEEIEVTLDLTSTHCGITSNSKYNVATISESGIFSISGNNLNEMPSVYNSAGQLVTPAVSFENNNLIVDLSQYPKGLYILKTSNNTFKLAK